MSEHPEHRRIRDLLGPYVLDSLDPAEEWETERHLRECASCRDEEHDLRQTHEHLAQLAETVEVPPPELKSRILERLPRRGRSRWIPAAAAAVLCVFAVLAVAYSSGLFAGETTTTTLEPTRLAPGAGGELLLRSSTPNTRATLEVWDLPPLERGEYYELWFGEGRGRVSAGTFTVDEEGRGTLYMSVPSTVDYERVGITRERFPEEPRMESARVVLGGELPES
jgi:anti-sigma-K factor RskA